MILSTEVYDFMESAEKAFTSEGFNFAECFDNIWNTGYVFKGPGYLVLGIEDPERLDAWLIWWAEMYPRTDALILMQTVLKLMPYHKPYFGFVRRMKGESEVKYYSTDRIVAFTTELPTTHASNEHPT